MPGLITREEAFLIFGKLYAEKLLVLCAGALWGWSILSKGRIVALSDSEIRFKSLDGETALILRLDLEDEVFMYGEPWELPGMNAPEEDKDAAAVVVGLPLRFSPTQLAGPLEQPKREKLAFLELRERERA